jgi:hypothetical protein
MSAARISIGRSANKTANSTSSLICEVIAFVFLGAGFVALSVFVLRIVGAEADFVAHELPDWNETVAMATGVKVLDTSITWDSDDDEYDYTVKFAMTLSFDTPSGPERINITHNVTGITHQGSIPDEVMGKFKNEDTFYIVYNPSYPSELRIGSKEEIEKHANDPVIRIILWSFLAIGIGLIVGGVTAPLRQRRRSRRAGQEVAVEPVQVWQAQAVLPEAQSWQAPGSPPSPAQPWQAPGSQPAAAIWQAQASPLPPMQPWQPQVSTPPPQPWRPPQSQALTPPRPTPPWYPQPERPPGAGPV